MVLSLSSSTTLKSTAALTLFLLGATTTSTTTFATAAANNNSSSSSFALSPSPFKQQRSSTFLTSSTSPSTTTTSSNLFNNNQVTKMPTKTSKIMATSSSSTSSSPSSTKDVKQTHTKEEQKNLKIWNRFANNYAKSPIADEDAYNHKLQLTRKYMNKDTTNALEFGCGTGGTALLHSPYVKHYHATDVSSTMIDICKEKQIQQKENGNVDNVSFECIGIDSLAAAKSTDAAERDDGYYDMVLGLSILHLLPQKDQTIRDVHSMLKPGGYFVSSTTCLKEISGFKFVSPILKLGGYFGLLPTLNPFSKDELIQSIEKNDLFDIKELYHPGPDKAVFIIAQKK